MIGKEKFLREIGFTNRNKNPTDALKSADRFNRNEERVGSVLSFENSATLRSSNLNFDNFLRKKNESSASFYNNIDSGSKTNLTQDKKSMNFDSFSAVNNESIGQRLKKQDHSCFSEIQKKKHFIE